MSQFRAYFYNLNTRKEMTEFEGNGKTWLQTGGYAVDDKGAFIKGTTNFVCVANYASMNKIVGEKRIEAKDFDFPVAVKIWYGPDNIEWRKLV